MGASPLFPLFVAVFFLGVAALTRNHVEMNQVSTVAAANAALQAATFLNYRSVVTTYAQTHPGWTGTVPAAVLTAQGITVTAQGQIGHQVVASTSGRQLVVFAGMPGKEYEVFRLAEGDVAIGLAVNGQFKPFNQGPAAALPITIPNGNVVSFVEVGS